MRSAPERSHASRATAETASHGARARLGDGTGPHLDQVVSDLQTLLKNIQAAVAQINDLLAVREPDGSVPGPKTCAGALSVYVGPLLEQINDATSSVDAFVNPSATYQLNRDLAMVARGLTWSAQAATTARAWNRAHGSRAPRATHL